MVCQRERLGTSAGWHVHHLLFAGNSLEAMGGPLFVDDGGRTWFAPLSGGLYVLENGAARRIDVPGLKNDVIYSIDGTKDELWLGRQQGGLTELTMRDKTFCRSWMQTIDTRRNHRRQARNHESVDTQIE